MTVDQGPPMPSVETCTKAISLNVLLSDCRKYEKERTKGELSEKKPIPFSEGSGVGFECVAQVADPPRHCVPSLRRRGFGFGGERGLATADSGKVSGVFFKGGGHGLIITEA